MESLVLLSASLIAVLDNLAFANTLKQILLVAPLTFTENDALLFGILEGEGLLGSYLHKDTLTNELLILESHGCAYVGLQATVTRALHTCVLLNVSVSGLLHWFVLLQTLGSEFQTA